LDERKTEKLISTQTDLSECILYNIIQNTVRTLLKNKGLFDEGNYPEYLISVVKSSAIVFVLTLINRVIPKPLKMTVRYGTIISGTLLLNPNYLNFFSEMFKILLFMILGFIYSAAIENKTLRAICIALVTTILEYYILICF